MGLDVYLYEYENKKSHDAYEKKLKAAEEGFEIWADEISEEERKKRELLFSQWQTENPRPSDAGSTKIEIDSKVLPEHMFKIGYLRSSYNDGGIERILRDRTGKDLNYIFLDGKKLKDYVIKPNWKACLVRCRDARAAFDAYLTENGDYRVREISPNVFSGSELLRGINASRALEMFQKQRKEYAERKKARPDDKWLSGSYSNQEGEYSLDQPMHVAGIIHGEATLSGFLGKGGVIPATYVIYKYVDENGKSDMDWYRDALAITNEMIEWVLGQPDPQKFYLHWSG
jgi:hypothetical protein